MTCPNFALLKNSNLLSHPANQPNPDLPPAIGSTFVELATVDSTNNYAMARVHEGLAFHGAAYFAHDQSLGKGQRGKSWTSSPHENIVLSIVLQPGFLQLSEQFMLNAAIALGCYDFLKLFIQDEVFIKWPNDIYWRDRKAGGILIESISKGRAWLFAVAGIGINVNQEDFSPNLPNPVSMKQITGQTFVPLELAKILCDCLEKTYLALTRKNKSSLLSRYNDVLYKRNQITQLNHSGKLIQTRILEVNDRGQLLTVDEISRSFELSEVQWLT
jgi:BirA family biotin operon repressor/biotin-[acetyl-CoA-carboxylase] ligase